MTPSELTRQEEHLFAVLSGERFLKMEGLSKTRSRSSSTHTSSSTPSTYEGEETGQEPTGQQGHRGPRDQPHDLSVDVLKERGDWDEVLEVEPDLDKAEFTEMLQSMLNPQQHRARDPGTAR